MTTPIRHIVVIYQENHSFDETLGALCRSTSPARCDGHTGSVRLQDGSVVSQKVSPDIVPKMDHTVAAQKAAINGGKMNGWARVPGCEKRLGYRCLTYYVPRQIPNLAALARKFGISDRTFSMADSSSWGGHIYPVAASLGGFYGDNPKVRAGGTAGPGWGCDSKRDAPWRNSSGTLQLEPSCIPDDDPQLALSNGGAYRPSPVPNVPTIMRRLDAANLSWRMYAAGASQTAYIWSICPTFAECLYGPQHANMTPVGQVLTDARNGTLPNYSLVLPQGPTGSTAQHNGESMLHGDNWIGQVVSAIENGPDWSSTAIFITYDDCGCFYDHVPPPKNADGTQRGPRVPMVIVSPYAKPGYTDSTNATVAGILAFTEHTFGLPALGVNDAHAYDFSAAFDYTQAPLTGVRMTQHYVPPAVLREVARNALADEDDPT